jgi:hypothetical protein
MSTIIFRRGKAEVDREIEVMRRFTKKITRSKKAAREFLIRGGFITKDGQLTKRYR